MGDFQIDKITRIVLMCKSKDGEDCAVTYDVEFGDTASASVSIDGTLPPELTVTARVGTMTMSMFENEMDGSSEELDCFLEQFLKE